MSKREKVKVTLLVDAETYSDFKRNTAKYPRGIASFVFQHTMEMINLDYEINGKSTQLEFFDNIR